MAQSDDVYGTQACNMLTRRILRVLATSYQRFSHPACQAFVHLNGVQQQSDLLTQHIFQSNISSPVTRSYCTSDTSTKFEVINVQDEEHFKDLVLKSKEPVIVDFHATWCGPCKLLAPRLEKVMTASAKPVKLVKVDIDKLDDLAVRYRVRGVPTVFAFKAGRSVDSFVGLVEEDVIEVFVSKLTQ